MPIIKFDNEEDDDWIRSPQVTEGHPSDAELFGTSSKKLKVVKKAPAKRPASKRNKKTE